MHTEIVRGLRIGDAPLLDQPHSLKLELACKLPSLHDPPPVPLKHLTRCLRNRVQASHQFAQCASSRDSKQMLLTFLSYVFDESRIVETLGLGENASTHVDFVIERQH